MKALEVMTGQNRAGMWYAFCHVTELGDVTQWEATEAEAKENLKWYVTEVLKAEWID